MPKVSVVIPTYNCADYVSEAIDSVLDQTFRDYEIIVVDSSSDNTQEILKKKYWDNIKFFYQEGRGVSAARNFGIKKANGKYIAFLDGDDIWLPNKLELQVSAIESNPNAGIVFTDGTSFDDKGTVIKSWIWDSSFNQKNSFKNMLRNKYFNDSSILLGNYYKELLLYNFISTCSALVKKECLEEMGYFDESIHICEDYDLWLKIASRYPIMYINQILAAYRFRNSGLSGAADMRSYLYRKWQGRIFEKHLPDCPKQHKVYVKKRVLESYNIAAWGYLNAMNLQEARRLSLESLRCSAFQVKTYIYLLSTLFPRWLLRSFISKQHSYAKN